MPPTKEKRITLTCYTTQELKDRVREYAERQQRSVANATNLLLQSALDAEDRRQKLTG
jgi:hypothetical protein